ncbi:flagella basal body P-ring formation protein FlgA [Escherichia coli]
MLAQCGSRQQYLQVSVQAMGEYVAAAPIVRGKTPIEAAERDVDARPARSITASHHADAGAGQDAISLRDVAIGQPIQLSMVRQSWRVKAGQKVMVIAQGDGFEHQQ